MSYLEHLTTVLSCEYLSDLRYKVITPRQARDIMGERERWPLSEYQEAADYILGKRQVFSTSLDARHAIVERLLKRVP